MALTLRFAAASDVGTVRSNNQDSAYAGRYLAVVADGMGGHVGGDVASASTVLDLVHLDQVTTEDVETVLPDEIQTANSILNELVSANPKLSGMGTTVTALLLTGDTFQYAHIGDSRAYRLKDGRFTQMSRDHTFVQRLVEEGRLSPTEAEGHPHKNVLLRVLGDSDASPELDIHQFPVAPGERWLLCSDGLNAVVSDPVIEQIVRNTKDLQETADDLVKTTLDAGSPDNVTVVVVEVVETSDHPEETPAIPFEAIDPEESSPDTGMLQRIAGSEDVEASAAIIRHEMKNRPHVLVGSALLATQTGHIPMVTTRSAQKRAAALLMHKTPKQEAEVLEQRQEEHYAPKRRWVVPAFLTLMGLILAAVLWIGYLWTQTQYYVGNYDGRVAIFNGVSQDLGPLKLSSLDSVTEVPLDALPAYTQQRLKSSLPARDLAHAQSMVSELLNTARKGCPEPPKEPKPGSTTEAEPSASPSPSDVPSYCLEAADE
ncbi:protein phosphatase 2C domain-containing protein [Zhihengliuella somnathii]